jgi:SNF2 family DNA or RNA helicase
MHFIDRIAPVAYVVPHHLLYKLLDMPQFVSDVADADLLIMDESTAIKNAGTRVAKSAQKIAGIVRYNNGDGRCIICTGRPCPESYTEIWSQFNFAFGSDKNPLGSSYYTFLRHWFVKGDWNYALDLQKESEFLSIIGRHSLTFTDEMGKEFQTKLGISRELYCVERCTLSQPQIDLVTTLRSTWSLDNMDFAYTMQILQKHQQITSGFYYTHQHKPVWLSPNPKMDLLLDMLRALFADGHRKIVVWTHYSAEYDLILHTLTNTAWNPAELVVTYASKSPGSMEEFSITNQRAVIVSGEATAAGINYFSCADVDIFYSNGYKQEIRDQEEARIRRLGQQSSTIMHMDLCTDSIDSDIVAALQAKNLTDERLEQIARTYLPTGRKTK